ncbi:MAG: iron-sulfur cluster assembly scaffold protein [Christensenellales bacterium]
MYDDLILSKLNNLKYLTTIKKSNITITSKKNIYNDTVKFYAQINKEDVIQKISFKASGCTYFMVFCDYFCGLVEGKTVKNALKINSETLENYIQLDENRKHIINIILDTFALLIKKYRKGVEKGLIEPCEVIEKQNPKELIKVSSQKNKLDTNYDISDILITKISKRKTGASKSSNSPKNQNSKSTTINEETSQKKTKSNSKRSKIENSNVVIEEKQFGKTKKSSKKKEILEDKKIQQSENQITEIVVPDEIILNDKVVVNDDGIASTTEQQNIQKIENNVITTTTATRRLSKKTKSVRTEDNNIITEQSEQHSFEMTQTVKENNIEKSKRQSSNILALQSMIKTSKNVKSDNDIERNAIKDSKVKSLSLMLNKISKDNNKQKINNDNAQEEKVTNKVKTAKNSTSVTTKETKKKSDNNLDAKTKETEIKTADEPKKKSLFGWFRKNK